MNRTFTLSGCLFVIFFSVLFSAGNIRAADPWTWQMTLDGKGSGKSMLMPSSLYIDQDKHRYYVVDSGQNRILSFDKEGKFLHVFSAEGQLESPVDMIKDRNDILWVIEKGRKSLTRINVKEKEIVPHVLRDGEHELLPQRIEYADGYFYILDRLRGAIAVVDENLDVQRWIASAGGPGSLIDFKLEGDFIWGLSLFDKKVFKFTKEGSQVQAFSVEREMSFPVSLAIGPSGLVYLADRHQGVITVYDAHGIFKYTFLKQGQSRGHLYYPVTIRFDPWGNFCVVEEGNARVEIFSR